MPVFYAVHLLDNGGNIIQELFLGGKRLIKAINWYTFPQHFNDYSARKGKESQ